MEKDLRELVEKLKQAAGDNLKSVVLYGSAASGDFQPKHSDLNILCVLERLDGAELAKLNPTAAWWARKDHPAPLVFTLEELHRLADVFAIELLDIQASRRVLDGEDVFASLRVPMSLHREQVERELHTNLVRLRQGSLATVRSDANLERLMSASVSTFVALFRHALIALDVEPPQAKRAVVDRLASLLGFDASGLHAVLDAREGKRPLRSAGVPATFAAYLAGVTRVAEEVDRRLASGNSL